ncbi:SPFH/Band 7/PHB domain protein [Candidatus Woesearchaeota archaeon]|nr:SPFH/Band 7/PHB domain protein [Candidatus Woesearchaeota archaeon]
MSLTMITIATIILITFFAGIKIIRPTERGIVETLGKFSKVAQPGFNWIIPVIQRITKVNITERMVDITEQIAITKDKLNCIVDGIVYYKILDVRKAIYNVEDHRLQLASLASTTLRAVIGQMTFSEANENRDQINTKIEKILDKETNDYGVDVLRVEIQKIETPRDVQAAMNEVVKAEQKKIAAKDFATAIETEADGKRRAEIKKAEGVRQAKILEAQGDAEAIRVKAEAKAVAIKVENEAADRYFKGNAKIFKSLETVKETFNKNTKLIIDSKSNVNTIVTDVTGANIVPVKEKKKK